MNAFWVRSFGWVVTGATLLVLPAALVGCDRPPPSEKLTPWSPKDHDGEQKSTNERGPMSDAGGASALIEATWQGQCTPCHGPVGRGDGPQGAMFKASDLTDPKWQANVKDEDIARVIVSGKGRMPKFELPPEVVQGLVVRIRAAKGQGP